MESIGHKVYAAKNWTVKDILQHLTDRELVFSYRALSFALREKNVTSFEEDNYAQMNNANKRSLEDQLEEAILVRKSAIKLYNNFTPVEVLDLMEKIKMQIGYIFRDINIGILKYCTSNMTRF